MDSGDRISQEDHIPFIDRLSEWTKSSDIKSGEMGRILAILLTVIVICYVILLVARIVVTLALPTLVIVVLLLVYRFVSLSEMEDGIKEVPGSY
ncbi:uncharacterized protein LOC108096316 isoform X2 [Drosophila ficusphila]|uniref:uncharacterized protein LOC108096316 isoform X2 n=1 Tax=Drosophila ficusphila TaxID=30025 RepID=UPI0007E89051|nr:uncharacterized protein LOC108096316 isoform X2 [Drosophila ficusphila]